MNFTVWKVLVFIERVNTAEWIAPLLVVWKTSGKIRLCIDLRKLNENIVVDKYPLPDIEELLHELAGAKFFHVSTWRRLITKYP